MVVEVEFYNRTQSCLYFNLMLNVVTAKNNLDTDFFCIN